MRVKTVSATEQLPLSTAFDYNNVSRTSSKESTTISGRELSVLACVSFIIGVFAVQLQQQEHATPSPVPPYPVHISPLCRKGAFMQLILVVYTHATMFSERSKIFS